VAWVLKGKQVGAQSIL